MIDILTTWLHGHGASEDDYELNDVGEYGSLR